MTASSTRQTHDVILVGGGLANGLIARRLAEYRPGLKIALIEAGTALGGNHTWSFHDTDVAPDLLIWLRPLIDKHWPDQEVIFPRRKRRLETGYNSMSSNTLATALTDLLGAQAILLNAPVVELTPRSVRLRDGRELTADLVIDGRGALARQPLTLGFQKFIGLEVETTAPHGQPRPIIMDATVSQTDGYRFVYTLPYTPTRLLIEDTYYSDGADLAPEQIEPRIAAYAKSKGWHIDRTVRREQGVLPITLDGDIEQHWRNLGSDIPVVGLRAWLFHPTTGYSLPQAAAVAAEIAAMSELTSRAVAAAVIRRSTRAWREQAFYRVLNRLLFVAAQPASRYTILERFYGLSQALIERFYAGHASTFDKVRILTGRPPLSITRAVASLPASSVRGRADAAKSELNLG